MQSSAKRANLIGGLVSDGLRGLLLYVRTQICVCDYGKHQYELRYLKVLMRVVFAFFFVACCIYIIC